MEIGPKKDCNFSLEGENLLGKKEKKNWNKTRGRLMSIRTTWNFNWNKG